MLIISLENFEKKLSQSPYVCGFSPSQSDLILSSNFIEKSANSQTPNISRWLKHIKSFSDTETDSWPVGDQIFELSLPQNTSSSTKMVETPSEPQDLPKQILLVLKDGSKIDTLGLAKNLGVDHQKIVGAMKSLVSLELILAEQLSRKQLELSEEGCLIVKEGSHEARLFNAIPVSIGLKQADLMKSIPNAKFGFSKAMSAGWVNLDKKTQTVTRKVDSIEDTVQKALLKISQGQQENLDEKQISEFKKRKLLNEVTVKYFELSQGPNFSLEITKPETELTADMIASGSWKQLRFKQYNFDALGIPPQCGHLHPLLKVRAEFRQIFLEMGFSEMPTNNYVESCFWNFDALFQPQQHPARDAHDTFFLSDPAECQKVPEDYAKIVADVHSKGGFGSEGYKYDWKMSEARKNILRTHTTAVSARVLYELAKQKPFKPAKYFSIDRVYRNESLDATHLAEFHQVEGWIADRKLTLGHLIGTLHEFFSKLGIEKLRFKPTYNPYTEPSMEVFSYHEGFKKWVEIGNSGVFRPEMLLPMGLPEDVSVIAWGLSLERPTMIKYGIQNIRDLIGPKVNLKMVYDNPICRLDK